MNVGAGEAEPEEGEIPNSDDDVVPNDAEYEAISSDEEYALRQKIQALEARNLELEKIHKISARSQVAYGKTGIFKFIMNVNHIFTCAIADSYHLDNCFVILHRLRLGRHTLWQL